MLVRPVRIKTVSPKLTVLPDTKLADKSASAISNRSNAVPTSPISAVRTSTPTAKGKAATIASDKTDDPLSTLRTDLAATQKARAALQAQVDDLTTSLKTLEAQSKASTTQIALLTRQKVDGERKLRDRDEEIRGKSKLVTEAQDEMVALSLQLNMAEQTSEKLQKDNKELLDRWMTSKREEADRMNRDSSWQ